METEILNIISHRVTDARIKSELRKKDMLIGANDFETAIDNLVSSSKFELRGSDTNKMYFIITHQDDTILVPQTQESEDKNSGNENTIELLNDTSNLDKTSQASTHTQTINLQSSYDEDIKTNDIFKELQSFKDFQSENELSKKDAIIDYLTKRLVISTESNSHSNNNSANNNVVASNNRNMSMPRDFTCHLNSAERSGSKDGIKKAFVVGASMLNDNSECGISKQHSVKVRNFPGAITDQSKPDLIITDACTNDLATKTSPLNDMGKILKKYTEFSPKTKLAFSDIFVRKHKVNLEWGGKDINSKMKNVCQQKGIGGIDNSNITENHFGMKKLQLNSKGNTAFAEN